MNLFFNRSLNLFASNDFGFSKTKNFIMKTMSKVLFTFISSFICYSVFAQKSIQLSVDRVYDAEEKSDEAVKNSILANSQIFQIDENHRLEREGKETILYRRSGSKKLKEEQGGQQVCRINNLVLEGLVNSEEEVLLITLDKQDKVKVKLEKYDNDLNQIVNKDLSELGIKMVYHFYELFNGNIFITAKVVDGICSDDNYSAMVLDNNGKLLHSTCIENMSLIRKLKPKPFPIIEFNNQIIIPKNFDGNHMGEKLFSFSMDLWQKSEIEIPVQETESLITLNNKLGLVTKSKLYELSEIAQVENDLFKIYPSPTNKELNIISIEIDELHIYSVSGVRIVTVRIKDGKGVVDISGLEDGLYFIGNGRDSKMQRFVKIGT